MPNQNPFERAASSGKRSTTPMELSVFPCNIVVQNQMCVGCGVCAGVCPLGFLRMEFNSYGEYQPVPTKTGCLKCGLCLKLCPFAPENVPNEDALGAQLFSTYPGIRHSSAIGYYLACYVGHVAEPELRWSRSSGGLASWLLASLLQRGVVDAIWCVIQTSDKEKRFTYARLTDPAQVWQASKSAYYPVEVSSLLGELQNANEKVAVIGLPCFIKGLRKAMMYIPHLQRRILIIAGLVCGQCKSKYFCDYLIRRAGLSESEVITVSFREKLQNQPSHNFAFAAQTSSNKKLLAWSQGYGYAWTHDYFKINACNYCDDLFAELADVSFMDAWLSEYSNHPEGTSIIVIRNPYVQHVFERGVQAGELCLKSIDPERVVASQKEGLHSKRRLLAIRLALKQTHTSEWPWVKRVRPADRAHWWERVLVRSRMRAMRLSKIAFQEQKAIGPGLRHFGRRMRRGMLWVYAFELMMQVIQLSRSVVQKILRTFGLR